MSSSRRWCTTSRESQPSADRELYDGAACGLLSTDASGTVTNVNRTFCSWLGFAPEELVGRKRLQDLLTVGCKIFHQTHWMPLLQMQGSVSEVQLEMLHAEGRTLPMLVNAIRRTEHGTIRHDLAAFLVHDRKLYEREAAAGTQTRRGAARERARGPGHAGSGPARARARGATTGHPGRAARRGIVSHDLRTPLNTIFLGASVLTSSGISSTQGRTVNRITNAASRATRLIEALLDFTQARLGGGLRVTRRMFDVRSVIAECVDELKQTWPGRPILYTHEGPEEVNADPDRLAQVITNLVNNALTYGAPTQPINVSSSTVLNGSAPTFTVRVHNHGEPIPPELIPHIFEALRRGEKENKHGSRSVGLGLYIVQQIARAHGGDVSVQSSRDAGTTFVVSIPLV